MSRKIGFLESPQNQRFCLGKTLHNNAQGNKRKNLCAHFIEQGILEAHTILFMLSSISG
jgi:hypothetical protein